MWNVWSNPEHIAKWWGPNGFTNSIDLMDFRAGGEWKFTMHAPNGTNFPNRSIFKEIVTYNKIKFEHFNPHFITTVLFEPNHQDTTIHWSMVFDSAEMYATIVKAHKADEGLKQNLERLEVYLKNLGKT